MGITCISWCTIDIQYLDSLPSKPDFENRSPRDNVLYYLVCKQRPLAAKNKDMLPHFFFWGQWRFELVDVYMHVCMQTYL